MPNVQVLRVRSQVETAQVICRLMYEAGRNIKIISYFSSREEELSFFFFAKRQLSLFSSKEEKFVSHQTGRPFLFSFKEEELSFFSAKKRKAFFLFF